MEHASERTLVDRCRSGDDEALAELVDQYKNLVFGVISQVVADRSRVEDLAQDVFLRIHRGLPSFRGESKLSTWIYRIVRNVCYETHPERAHTISLDTPDADGRSPWQPGATDRAFSDFELRDELEKAIAELPDQWRLLISAHYFAGQPYQELAEIFEMPIGTVKTQLHRAKLKLREVILKRLGTKND